MNLLDTLSPATPPDARGARTIRPMDDPRDNARPDPAPASAISNKSARLRQLLHDAPDGLGYSELANATGIARDKIASHVAALILAGDAKPYEIEGRGRIFKFSGDPARIGSRAQEPGPRAARRHPSAPDNVSATAPATFSAAPSKEGAGPAAAAPAPPAAPPASAPPVADSAPKAETRAAPAPEPRTATVMVRELREATLDDLVIAAIASTDPHVSSLGRRLTLLDDLQDEFERDLT